MTQGPGVLFAPNAHVALERGIDRLANLIRPTLGPTPRCVAIESTSPGTAPEILDDAATILRRIVQLPDPYVDMGAMIIRHTLWRTSTLIGDGTATTGVLLQALVHSGARYIRAGGDATAFRRGLATAAATVILALREMATPLEDQAEIERAALAICHDHDMARLLGEMFDIVGKDGHVLVETHPILGYERMYVEGAHWYEGLVSPYFITDVTRQEARLDNAAVFISNLRLTTADQLVPLLQMLAETKRPGALIIAREVSNSALSLLVTNHQAKRLQLMAVKPPSYGDNQAAILRDLAVLTGGRVLLDEAGDRAQRVRPEDLGSARHAWATTRAFGIRGGEGDARHLRQHIQATRAQLRDATDDAARKQIQERLGRLVGGVAILQVGGTTNRQQEARKATAERAVTTLRHALAGGVVPGGGSAYVHAQRALDGLDLPEGEQVAVKALREALEEPLKTIVRNAGHDAAPIVRRVKDSSPTTGFDASAGVLADMVEAGIVDPLEVVETALKTAASGAAMVLTTDVLIHHRNPTLSTEP
jgi:chaperonin GroEL